MVAKGNWGTATGRKRSRWWEGGRAHAHPRPLHGQGFGGGAPAATRAEECLRSADAVSLAGAARARGGGTRPAPPARGKGNCCTLSSWSSCGTWRSLRAWTRAIAGGRGLTWFLQRNHVVGAFAHSTGTCAGEEGSGRGLKLPGKGRERSLGRGAGVAGCWWALEQTDFTFLHHHFLAPQPLNTWRPRSGKAPGLKGFSCGHFARRAQGRMT